VNQVDRPGGLFGAVVDHPVAVTMIFLAALVFGFVGYQRLPVELMPDISYPTITVRTVYDGAAPQEVEAQISRPVEEALATLDGLVSLESRSRAGASDVVLGFDWGTDMAEASQTIRENLQTTWLPQEADRPLILRYDPSLDPFLRVALAVDADAEGAPEGDKALFALREVAERELKRELEGLPGVAAVAVQGGLEREIRVQVREDWLAARQVTLAEVRDALTRENINLSGGSIVEGDVEYLIRTLNQFQGVRDLSELRIRRADGVRVPLTDVALLSEDHKEREVVTKLDGGEAVLVEVFKEADANVVDVARRVKAALHGDGVPAEYGGSPGLAGQLPDGFTLAVLDDQAAFIELAIGNLWSTALLGGVLAVAILFLFLRDVRATAVIGVAIPLSVVIGFAPLYLLGVSLNLMSLGGLALGVGMLVDNAVVVLESIQRYREEGLSVRDAAVVGTADVASAVVASTLTTVAVFFPIAFVEGVAGELFGDLSLAVVASLMASLAAALFAVPMLSSLGASGLPEGTREGLAGVLVREEGEGRLAWARRVLRTAVAGAWADLKGAWSFRTQRWWGWLLLPYALLRFVLHAAGSLGFTLFVVASAVAARIALWLARWVVWPFHRVSMAAAGRFQRSYQRVAGRYAVVLDGALKRPGTVAGAAVAMLVVALAVLPALGTELIPELHQGRITAQLALPVGTPLERTQVVVAEAERRVRSHPLVDTVHTTVGVDRTADASGDEGEHTARLRLQLVAGPDMAAREARVMDDLRRELAGLQPLEVTMSRPALFSFRTPVEVVLYGYDLDQLKRVGDQVAERLGRDEGLRDVQSSLQEGHPEVRIQYDRERLHRLGLDPFAVAQQVREKVQGVEATQIQRGDQRIALRVQLEEPDRGSIDDLRDLNVNPELRPVVPLSAVADFVEAVGPSEIRRVDQQRAVVVSANLGAFDLGTAGDRIQTALRSLALPPEVRWEVAGQSSEMESSLASLRFALGLAVFLVYVIMASTFESLKHPLVILFSVPLAVVGAVGGLALFGHAVSVVVFIGVIVLAGVVVNNAIVLVDTINRLRADGLERDEAVRRAGALRVRPILITTATTVLGLLPLAFGAGAGAEMQGPLAVTVIGGLMSSTLLTLVVVPVVYRLFDGRTQPEPAVDAALVDAGGTLTP
jgi:HAE1 family hydrophobic/amphiphilic exporter-1